MTRDCISTSQASPQDTIPCIVHGSFVSLNLTTGQEEVRKSQQQPATPPFAAYLDLHVLHLLLSSQQLLAQKLHLRIRLWEVQF